MINNGDEWWWMEKKPSGVIIHMAGKSLVASLVRGCTWSGMGLWIPKSWRTAQLKALVASPFFGGVPLVPDLNSAPIDNRRVADLKMGDESGWQTQGILCVPIQSSSGLQQRHWAPKDFRSKMRDLFGNRKLWSMSTSGPNKDRKNEMCSQVSYNRIPIRSGFPG